MKGKRQLGTEDAEAVKELIESAGWQLMHNRIVDERARLAKELQSDIDHNASTKLRGQIAALNTVLKIPDILISEAKANRKADAS